MMLKVAHTFPMGGHLGRDKMEACLKQRMFWPGLYKLVERYCWDCPECHKVSDIQPAHLPLVPLPLFDWPFDPIALDIAGPCPKSNTGYQFVLVIIDYATRFPEAIHMKSVTATKIAEELMKWVSCVGIPQEILTY